MFIVRPELLAQPNIIKPLHGLNPRGILWDAWRNRERKMVYAKNDYHCMACGIHKDKAKYHQWLEAHEVYDIDFETCTYTLKEIVPLCHSCHNYIHDGRLSALHNKGEISARRFSEIIRHWREILKKAWIDRGRIMYEMCGWNLSLREPETNGTWSEWWLALWDKKYKTKFKSYMEWLQYYNS